MTRITVEQLCTYVVRSCDWFQFSLKNALVFLLFLQAYTTTASSPDSLLQPTSTIAIEASLLTSDKLQQCYVVTKSNELIKYNSEGDSLFSYSNNRLGILKSVDVTDPFNVLLFYPDYYTVILLDRTLSVTGEFQLYDLNIADVEVVGMANDNNLWLYDENAGKVKKISTGGEVLEESVNTKILLNHSIRPSGIKGYNNLIYLNVPEIGILVFDNFGTFVKQIPLIGLPSFQIMEDQILYQKENKLFSYHLRSFLTSEIELPIMIAETDLLMIQKGMLFLLKAKELLIYKL